MESRSSSPRSMYHVALGFEATGCPTSHSDAIRISSPMAPFDFDQYPELRQWAEAHGYEQPERADDPLEGWVYPEHVGDLKTSRVVTKQVGAIDDDWVDWDIRLRYAGKYQFADVDGINVDELLAEWEQRKSEEARSTADWIEDFGDLPAWKERMQEPMLTDDRWGEEPLSARADYRSPLVLNPPYPSRTPDTALDRARDALHARRASQTVTDIVRSRERSGPDLSL